VKILVILLFWVLGLSVYFLIKASRRKNLLGRMYKPDLYNKLIKKDINKIS
jgi:hypothetical protein